MTAIRHLALCVALLVSPLAVHSAKAEPLMLTGFIDTINYTGLRLVGPGLNLDGEVFSAPIHRCGAVGSTPQPCLPGQSVSLGLHVIGFGEAGGVVDGVTFKRFVDISGDTRGELRLQFDLLFSGLSFILPPFEHNSSDQFEFTTPIMMRGTLSGSRIDGTSVFDAAVRGQGTALLFGSIDPLCADGGGRDCPLAYAASGLIYSLEAAPVPEPGTLLLVASGAAAGRRAWKQRARQKPAM